jgi:hypothetical protein
MYMFNALFKFDETGGLFSGDDPTPGIPAVLRKSNNWLELQGNAGTPNFPEDAAWQDLGQATTLLLHSNPNPGDICIRIAPDHRGPIPSNAATLQLVAAFGRPSPFFQPQASPFTHNGTPAGNILTTFVLGPAPRNTSEGWFLNLGRIVRRPGHPALSHRYQFSLGVIVTDGAAVRHYGEDPEMDVGN